ncbi:neuronal acetylcholine receptor subunit alpha-2-like [Branchiostoma floridae]|uniref:Neuronal acetylcholine receptor subunit alpha-2-like n=1 Tax=Branchiostoma floridae TaxID=7739 RepID=A0A9J7HEM6_BRAFL|nr:neuronal acetylcholine receptor subunit alpha-2-like [Branchiostoma floridae]
MEAMKVVDNFAQCGGGSTCDVWSPPQQEGEWNRKDKIFAEGNKKACFAVHLERIPLFHIATTVGPCVILVVLMTITFIMPIDRGDRISFGVTILLSMVVSLVFVTEVLPVKGALPFFATLIVVCMGLMGLFLFFTMYIISLHDKEGSLSPMAKTFFLHYMAKLLLLGDLTEKEAGPTGKKLAWPERANRMVPADDAAKVDGEETTDNVYEELAETDGKNPTDVFDGMIKVEVESQAQISDDVVKVDRETPADVSGTTGDIPAEAVAETDVETPAAVSGTPRQPSSPPTRLEAAVEEQTSCLRDLISIVQEQAVKSEQKAEEVIHSLEELAKAVKGDQEVSDYTLLTKVLDRLCLVLYVISVAVAVPISMYLGK